MIITIFYLLLIIPILLSSLIIVFAVAVATYIKIKYEPVKGVCTSTVRLDNKIVLVTGGNQGIGLEVVRDLANRGASVIIASRDEKRAHEAIEDITKTTGNKNIKYKHLDLTKFSSVRKFAEDFNESYERLDILINNAGCGGLKHKATEDGIDMTMQINYAGAFLLTNLLLDKLKASKASRIIIVSSLLHICAKIKPNQVNGMHTTRVFYKYSNSKLCQVLWAKALAKRLPSNVTVNSLHPGVVKTDIFNNIRPKMLLKFVLFLIDLFNFKTPKEGAQTTIHLAVAEEVEGVSGKYFRDCVEAEAEASPLINDDDFIEKLWNESILLTNTR